jgi:thiopurine S-methyltransferase
MQPEFWHERWDTGRIGFHQSAPDRNLRRHWAALELESDCRVFVPLCGKSLDLLWLRDRGHCVMGVELSLTAVEAFLMENGVPARRREAGAFDIYEAPELHLYRGDFFALTPALLGEIGAVYDRAALISWAPQLRARYVEHVANLIGPGTRMLLIVVEYPQSQMPGPPFSISGDEVRRLYSTAFQIREIGRVDTLASESRLRALGVTEFSEVSYRLVRL